MGSLRPWHLLLVGGCGLAVIAIVALVFILVMRNRRPR